MSIRERMKEARREDRFTQELEEAFRPRKDGDGTGFGLNWYTAALVLLCGIVMASLALPLYFGSPADDPGTTGVWVEGMASQIG